MARSALRRAAKDEANKNFTRKDWIPRGAGKRARKPQQAAAAPTTTETPAAPASNAQREVAEEEGEEKEEEEEEEPGTDLNDPASPVELRQTRRPQRQYAKASGDGNDQSARSRTGRSKRTPTDQESEKSPQSQRRKASSTRPPTNSQEPRGNEGTVHSQANWTLQLRLPDGSQISEQELEDLENGGEALLSYLYRGLADFQRWKAAGEFEGWQEASLLRKLAGMRWDYSDDHDWSSHPSLAQVFHDENIAKDDAYQEDEQADGGADEREKAALLASLKQGWHRWLEAFREPQSERYPRLVALQTHAEHLLEHRGVAITPTETDLQDFDRSERRLRESICRESAALVTEAWDRYIAFRQHMTNNKLRVSKAKRDGQAAKAKVEALRSITYPPPTNTWSSLGFGKDVDELPGHWSCVKVLGQGSNGAASLFVQTNEHGQVCERVVVKTSTTFDNEDEFYWMPVDTAKDGRDLREASLHQRLTSLRKGYIVPYRAHAIYVGASSEVGDFCEYRLQAPYPERKAASMPHHLRATSSDFVVILV